MPAWPNGVTRLVQDFDQSGYRASFGLWLAWPTTPPADPVSAADVVSSWATNVLPYFLACMATSASATTCRLTVRGTAPYSFVTEVAPNHGGGSEGATLAIAAGVYVQGSGGARGSGSRIHIPCIAREMYDNPGVLSTLGVNNLLGVCNALSTWPPTLHDASGGHVLLGTLQQRRGGQVLPLAEFDPGVAVIPTYHLETIARRLHQIRVVSPS